MAWTKAAIEAFVKSAGWNLYQGFTLPYGIKIPGENRTPTVDAAFAGVAIEGRDVLVIGSHYGAVANILKERGARRVVGYEARPRYAELARTIADILGNDIKLITANIEHRRPRRTFDIVTCFNVLHHIHYPIWTLAQIAKLTSDVLAIEWATLDTYNERHEAPPPGMEGWPVFLGDKFGCWYFTQAGLDHILRKLCGFRQVEHKDSPKASSRRLTICRR